jgi:hypothetical protein
VYFNDSLNGRDSVSRAKDKLTAAGTNDAMARMQLGQTLAQRGKDAEALTEYLWCFDHGLEQNPAFSGVRLSFLLSNIKNLAAHYPPAKQALETRRDERQAKLAAGSTDNQTPMDLVSLDNTLDQKENNIAVFDQLPAGSPVRRVILNTSADQFLEVKRYADVLQGTDGKAAFKEAVDQLNRRLNSVGKDNLMREQLPGILRRFATTKGAQNFEALAGLKRNQDGKDLAGQILKFDSSPATHTLLANAAQRAGNDELAQFVAQ